MLRALVRSARAPSNWKLAVCTILTSFCIFSTVPRFGSASERRISRIVLHTFAMGRMIGSNEAKKPVSELLLTFFSGTTCTCGAAGAAGGTGTWATGVAIEVKGTPHLQSASGVCPKKHIT